MKAEGERINRYLVRCGLCSRREADRMILAGRVRLNGCVLQTPGVRVHPEDRVEVDGQRVQAEQGFRYYMYYKPRGRLCARKDRRGRPLIYDALDIAPSVQSVGRLDMDSEGLLILTDDGGLAQRLMHPRFRIPRTYRVRVAGHLSEDTLARLREGGLDMRRGDVSEPWEVWVDGETRGHSWLRVTLHRGRWREVRRTLQACRHPVRRLIRIRMGSLSLDPLLRPGQIRALNAAELRALRRDVQ